MRAAAAEEKAAPEPPGLPRGCADAKARADAAPAPDDESDGGESDASASDQAPAPAPVAAKKKAAKTRMTAKEEVAAGCPFSETEEELSAMDTERRALYTPKCKASWEAGSQARQIGTSIAESCVACESCSA